MKYAVVTLGKCEMVVITEVLYGLTHYSAFAPNGGRCEDSQHAAIIAEYNDWCAAGCPEGKPSEYLPGPDDVRDDSILTEDVKTLIARMKLCNASNMESFRWGQPWRKGY